MIEDDPDLFAAKTSDLLRSLDKRIVLGKAARSSPETEYDWEVIRSESFSGCKKKPCRDVTPTIDWYIVDGNV